MFKELKPTSEEERTMLGGLRQINSTAIEWKRRFDFARTYRLLNEHEAQVAGRCMYREEFTQPQCQPYIGMVWVRRLSVPSFNSEHTRALVQIHFGREGFGGGAEIAEYHKMKTGWQRQKTGFASKHCWGF
jgi:hypothetical protein